VSFTPEQRRTLSALADTFVANVPPPDGESDPNGFYARTGSEVGVPDFLELGLDALAPEVRAGLLALLDGFGAAGIADAPVEAREAIVDAVAGSSPEAAIGVRQLRAILLSLGFTTIDESGVNPFWATIGYPAPVVGGGLPHAILPETPPADGRLSADVVVVGSGAGGGVIAAELAAGGRSVIVVEGGGYFDGESAVQWEVMAAPSVFYRGGGFTATSEGNVNLWAGPPSAAGRRSTGPTVYVLPPRCGTTGPPSTGCPMWILPRSTNTWTRCWRGWAPTTRSVSTMDHTSA
jgi:hypothetical protein